MSLKPYPQPTKESRLQEVELLLQSKHNVDAFRTNRGLKVLFDTTETPYWSVRSIVSQFNFKVNEERIQTSVQLIIS